MGSSDSLRLMQFSVCLTEGALDEFDRLCLEAAADWGRKVSRGDMVRRAVAGLLAMERDRKRRRERECETLETTVSE